MMNETTCGKNCLECTYKEALNCPGCKAGPGKTYGCTCELAKCCQDKGHETCQTCGHLPTCRTYQGRYRIPEYRQQRAQAEVLSIASAIVAVIGIWHEYPAHAAVLDDVDFEAAEKWLALRKWYFIALGTTFGSIVITLIIPILGLLALLAGAIGALVVSILKLVYLYHTAQVFREWLV